MPRKMCTSIAVILSLYTGSLLAGDVPTLPGTVYVAASKVNAIEPGQKVKELFKLNLDQDYTLQKIQGDLYVMFSQFYNVPFYVGKSGVLVVDPAAGSGELLLKAVEQVTALPVTSIVYSHHHLDHLEGSTAIVQAMKAKGVKVEVVASKQTNNILQHMSVDGIAPVSLILDVQAGQSVLDFEDLKIKFVGFEYPTHSLDHAMLLIDKYKVVIAPDFVSPDQLPFFRFSYGSGNLASYIDNLQSLYELPWTLLIGGHGNIGNKADVEFLKRFITDLEASVRKAVASAPDVDPRKYGSDSAIPYIQEPYIIKQVREDLDTKYERYSGYKYVIDSYIQEAIVYTATGVQRQRLEPFVGH